MDRMRATRRKLLAAGAALAAAREIGAPGAQAQQKWADILKAARQLIPAAAK